MERPLLRFSRVALVGSYTEKGHALVKGHNDSQFSWVSIQLQPKKVLGSVSGIPDPRKVHRVKIVPAHLTKRLGKMVNYHNLVLAIVWPAADRTVADL